MPESGRIQADLAEMRAFAEKLKSEADLGLKRVIDRADNEVQQGVRFGAAFEVGQVEAARPVLAVALAQAASNAVRQAEAAAILIEAMQGILDRNTQADWDSAQHLAIVEYTMSEAVAKAQQALAPPPNMTSGGVQFE